MQAAGSSRLVTAAACHHACHHTHAQPAPTAIYADLMPAADPWSLSNSYFSAEQTRDRLMDASGVRPRPPRLSLRRGPPH